MKWWMKPSNLDENNIKMGMKIISYPKCGWMYKYVVLPDYFLSPVKKKGENKGCRALSTCQFLKYVDCQGSDVKEIWV